MNTLSKFLAALIQVSLAGSLFSAEMESPAAMAVLASDAGVEQKARACQVLAIVGGVEAVPAFAGLLADPELAAYARTGLEVIADPAAGIALMAAIPKLDGLMLEGVINSLGVRREKAAVPILIEFARDPESGVSESAVSSLGCIATDEAVAVIRGVLSDGPQELKIPAAHAAMMAVGHLRKAGKQAAAKSLLKAVGSAEVPEHIRAAATALLS